MTTVIGDNIKQTVKFLQEKTGLKWTAQLTSKGFILYRKPLNDDSIAFEYNKWRDICCAYFDISYEQLDDESKKGSDVEPRHWCWYMMVAVSMINIDSIVKLLNKQKNRTSVLHAVRKIHSYVYRPNPDEKSCTIFESLYELYELGDKTVTD